MVVDDDVVNDNDPTQGVMTVLIAIGFMFLCCLLLVPVVGGALYMAFDGDIRRGRGELLWASGDQPPAAYLDQQAARRAAVPSEAPSGLRADVVQQPIGERPAGQLSA